MKQKILDLIIKLIEWIRPYSHMDERIEFATIKEDIDAQPTIDAAPVVHGRWIFKHNPITDPKKYFTRIVCSECNLHTGQKSNYCPMCGAKMDGA